MKTKLAMLLLFALAFHPALLLAVENAPAATAEEDYDAAADLDEEAILEDEEFPADEELALDEDLTEFDETAEAEFPSEE